MQIYFFCSSRFINIQLKLLGTNLIQLHEINDFIQ
jgi:hypothetical protein